MFKKMVIGCSTIMLFFMLLFFACAMPLTVGIGISSSQRIIDPSTFPIYYDAGQRSGIDWMILLSACSTWDSDEDPTPLEIYNEANRLANYLNNSSGLTLEEKLSNAGYQQYASYIIEDAEQFRTVAWPRIINHRFPFQINLDGAAPYSYIMNFGNRDSTLWGSDPHQGVDLPASQGTPLYAVTNSTVIKIGSGGRGGNSLTLQSNLDSANVFYYAHLTSYAPGIQVGANISIGQLVGYVGMTGNATGPHLHFGLYVNQQLEDPTGFLLAWEAFDKYYEQKRREEEERKRREEEERKKKEEEERLAEEQKKQKQPSAKDVKSTNGSNKSNHP